MILDSIFFTIAAVLMLLQIRNTITTIRRLAFLSALQSQVNSLETADFELAIFNYEKIGHIEQMFNLSLWTDHQYFPWFYKRQ